MDRKRTGGHIMMDQRGSAYIDLNDKEDKVGTLPNRRLSLSLEPCTVHSAPLQYQADRY